jgi:phage terminase large subunit
MPALKATVYKDFFDILIGVGQYNPAAHNKTDKVYVLNGNTIDFFSLDDHLKVHGRKRDILYVNEANEVDYAIYKQLVLRTRGRVIIDYNPSEYDSWVYDKVLPRSDCKHIITTYRDNPFLSSEQINEIERLKDEDEDSWKVYGEGVRGSGGQSLIYNYNEFDTCPATDIKIYGLDFGFSNDPLALLEIDIDGEDAYITEKLYQTKLTTSDILALLPEIVQNKSCPIWADGARPEIIEEIFRQGYDIKAAKKGAGCREEGISTVKRYRLHVHRGAFNTLKEIRSYRFKKDALGNPTRTPVEFLDHAMDAMRYALHSWHMENKVLAERPSANFVNKKTPSKKWI